MIDNPKFYLNEGNRCAQTLIKSFVSDKISLEQLDTITGRKNKQITSPTQIAYGLYQLKIPFIYPIKKLFLEERFNIIEEEMEKNFGKNIMKQLNLPFLKESVFNLKKSKNYIIEDYSDKYCLNKLIEEYAPICLINYDKFVGRENKKRGHYFLIKELEKDFAKVIDTGPCKASPSKLISIKKLEKSLMETPLDYGLILIKYN